MMIKLLMVSAVLLTGCMQTSLDKKLVSYGLDKKFSDDRSLFGRAYQQTTVLKGGASGAQLYKVSNGTKNYVLRDISHRSEEDRIREISAQKIASENGYGPELYAYDVVQGKLIMSFLEACAKPNDRHQEMIKLVEALKKMHRGPAFCSHVSLVEQIKTFDSKVSILPKGIDRKKIAHLLDEISSLDAYPKCSTHRDLNPNNIFFTDQEVKFIDFENAGLDDPFVDVATVIIFYQYDGAMENEFLSLYLGKEASQQDKDHLKLMKKAVSLFYGLILFLLSRTKDPLKETHMPGSTLAMVLKQYYEGRISLENQRDMLELALAFLHEAIDTN
ncbi:phosphotransferase [Candidatus Babeliales bacterium]|nr:phosphotransferase [Candidatus Babeliales bacterium]